MRAREKYVFNSFIKTDRIVSAVRIHWPTYSVADPRGGRPQRAPYPRPKIFSISCSFSENWAKSYVGAPRQGLEPPPTENPGSAPDTGSTRLKMLQIELHFQWVLLLLKSIGRFFEGHSQTSGDIWLCFLTLALYFILVKVILAEHLNSSNKTTDVYFLSCSIVCNHFKTNNQELFFA